MKRLLLSALLLAACTPSSTAATDPPAPDFDPSNGWAFNPPADTFRADALFDFRDLNEKTAGEHGTIKLSTDGMSFARGDGQPIRFWGGSDYVQGSTWADGV